jgi:hypothetical protein
MGNEISIRSKSTERTRLVNSSDEGSARRKSEKTSSDTATREHGSTSKRLSSHSNPIFAVTENRSVHETRPTPKTNEERELETVLKLLRENTGVHFETENGEEVIRRTTKSQHELGLLPQLALAAIDVPGQLQKTFLAFAELAKWAAEGDYGLKKSLWPLASRILLKIQTSPDPRIASQFENARQKIDSLLPAM